MAKHLDIDLGFKNEDEVCNSALKILKTDENCLITENAKWQKADKEINSLKGPAQAKDYDFYLTSPIARSSRILNKCSAEIKS